MLKKVKIFIVALSAMVMLFGGCLTVCASSPLPASKEEYKALVEKYQRDGFPYAVVYYQPDNSTALMSVHYYNTEPFVGFKDYFQFNKDWSMYYVSFNSLSGEWVPSMINKLSSSSYDGGFSHSDVIVKYSNFDIYRFGADKTKDDPFFWGCHH